jgi:hypothetical protein
MRDALERGDANLYHRLYWDAMLHATRPQAVGLGYVIGRTLEMLVLGVPVGVSSAYALWVGMK